MDETRWNSGKQAGGEEGIWEPLYPYVKQSLRTAPRAARGSGVRWLKCDLGTDAVGRDGDWLYTITGLRWSPGSSPYGSWSRPRLSLDMAVDGRALNS